MNNPGPRLRTRGLQLKGDAVQDSAQFTSSQRAALDAVIDWHQSSDRQVFRLFGYAGVGKTTIAREIPHLLAGACGHSLLVLYAAYTGKAAHVLRTKGCTGASTLHSLIYRPVPRDHVNIGRLREQLAGAQLVQDYARQLELQGQIAAAERDRDKPAFELNPDSDLAEADLLIVDEVSMVGPELAADLLSFGVKVLVLGDPAQLPPIGGAGALVNTAPDVLLTEVHRQAEGNPILALATRVRQGGRLTPADQFAWLDVEQMLHADQVIVGRNATRWSVIRAMRAARGRDLRLPEPGDRVMCLKNNRALEVFNGQQFWVLGVSEPDPRSCTITLTVLPDDAIHDDEPAAPREIEVIRSGFWDHEGQRVAQVAGWTGTAAAMTWAEAITCHKAQGSEWGHVAVVDESWVFRRDDPTIPARWLYTAITRAATTLTIGERVSG